jgi:FAD/FMN-containing dehydrogenase
MSEHLITIEEARENLLACAAFLAERIKSADGHAEAMKQIVPFYLTKSNVDLAAEFSNTVDDPFTRDRLLTVVAEKCAALDDDEYALQLAEAIEDSGMQAQASEKIAFQKSLKGEYEKAAAIAEGLEHPEYAFADIAIHQAAAGEDENARQTLVRIEFENAKVAAEQETDAETEDALFEQWNRLLENHNADTESSWFTTVEQDLIKMREFRHALPVAVNERIVRYRQRKVGTDMAVPDECFVSFLKFYKQKLDESELDYVIFGHIGDNHLHANILPKNEREANKAKHLYGRFIAQAIMLGGTISAEHGIGKLKSKYLYVMYGERFLSEMAELKKSFDPNGILGRGNIFDAKFLGV